MAAPIKVIIADAQTITRNGLVKTLEAVKEIQVIANTACSAELISLCQQQQADMVLVSAAMPGINSRKLYRHIREEFPGIHVIIVADDHDAETIVALKTAGEFAWLYTRDGEEKIVNTILAVNAGTYKKEVYNGYGTNAVNRALLHSLTAKEKEVLAYFGTDLTAKEIAALQKVSRRTIEGHKEKLKEKLRVKGSAGLAIYALIHNTCLPTLLYWAMMLFTSDNPDLTLLDATA